MALVDAPAPVPPAIDTHLHIWDPARAPYPWLTPGLGILYYRARAPEEVASSHWLSTVRSG